MNRFLFLLATPAALLATTLPVSVTAAELRYAVVGTGQATCYDNTRAIVCPQPGQPFFGQDAQATMRTAAYRDNGDGTVTDLNTGLMWLRARGEKMTWQEANAGARRERAGGYSDWRMPTIKELYSLMDFSGGFHPEGGSVPYLDTRFFDFNYGNTTIGERFIDCQDWSATEYLGTTMNGAATVFGVNFADGRIKGYPRDMGARGSKNRLYARYVRGNPAYGRNDFHDNGDGTVLDRATGLTWSQADSGTGMDWPSALAWVQKKNAERHLGHADWRLPSAKELQSIVDYSRAPEATNPTRRGAAIDPAFRVTRLADGEFPDYWSGTTHLDGPLRLAGSTAVYVSFGRSLGFMRFPGSTAAQLMDVHGAGAQRSDPKVGDPAAYPQGRGPQGDVVRINNFVRLVRGG